MSNEWSYSKIDGKRIYTIYKATTPSGKCYVGYTGRKLKYRIKEHKTDSLNGSKNPFHSAISKYGDKVKFEIVNIYYNQRLAVKMEYLFMKKYKSLVTENGYNIECREVDTSKRVYTKKYRENQSKNSRLMWENNRDVMLVKLKDANKNNRFTKEAVNKSLEINRKPIIDDSGVIYKSLAEAGIENNVAESTIRGSIKNGYKLKSNGKKFAYYNNGDPKFKTPVRRKVKCLNNGKIYNTGMSAAIDLNLPNGISVNRVCRGERFSYKGYRFVYVN